MWILVFSLLFQILRREMEIHIEKDSRIHNRLFIERLNVQYEENIKLNFYIARLQTNNEELKKANEDLQHQNEIFQKEKKNL